MKYDLTVIGGGFSGVAAAVSAARAGLKVLLIEKSGSLGGAMSNCLVYPFMRFWTTNPENNERIDLSKGIFTEMREKHESFNPGATSFLFNPEYFRMVFDSMCNEAGVDVLFHAVMYDVVTKGREINSINVIAGSEKICIKSDFFIDATGDGNLFYMAGCDFTSGREKDGLCQPMTICFRMSGVDIELFKKDIDNLQKLYSEHRQQGKIKNPREDLLYFFGIGDRIVHFNTTRIVKLNPTDPFDVSKAEMMGREQITEIVNFLKENSDAFKNAALSSIAADIGIRESRKLKGEHILTEKELKDCVDFSDSIALGNYDIDIHNPEGSGTSHYFFKDGEYYKIPYRSLLPKEFDNLLVAGRCISTTHEAQASIRIMPICACLGEAAGIAVAVAKQTGTNTHTVNVDIIREKLRQAGAAV